MKCKICGEEIQSGKYCYLCEMKSQIIFRGSISDVIKKMKKEDKPNVKSK